jgi:hypothetical protein
MSESNEAGGTQPHGGLFPDHIPLPRIGPELNPNDPPCERTVRYLLDQAAVPYIKIAGVRFYHRDDLRRAILAREVNRQPRRPGRPRRAA